ncbi:glycosyl hydrolase [Patulibacter sp. SYSU D01012]|uniref:glycosyl hydrolase n=1 Tax=Patulibacter sp. SYSU D01012 TaxID=2817381 RepID=UPI001B318589|nr:glycosyl hydrolase [Patulibacter sp. SYSU D01012]
MRRREFVQRTSAAAVGAGALAAMPAGAAASRGRGRGPGRDTAPTAWPTATTQAKPWTRWWWLGSAVDDAGIAANLQAYRDAGIGGVEIQPIYGVKGNEAKNRAYLSPEWVAALDSTTRTASRLGMGVDMTTGSGWPFGGPWVADEDGAAKVLIERWTVAEGQRLSVPVRASNPPKNKPVPPLDRLVARAADGSTVDLTEKVGADGTLDAVAPAGGWELTAVFVGRVRMAVKRAAPGSEGVVIDYVSERALPNYLRRFDEALGGGSHGLRAMFHDSYEVGAANWTDTMVADFAQLRGYDVVPYLPEVAGQGDEETRARVRSDVRETFADLLLSRFTERWSAWNEQHGWRTRNQAHGSPANLLDLYARVDIPETESFGPSAFPIPGLREDPNYSTEDFGRPDPLVMRFASSAAHVEGKPLASSESCTWLAEHFHVSLSQMKPELDQLFAAGINHVFFHGTTYSPPEEAFPGLNFYASTEVTPQNTLWRDLPELTAYVTRSQSILQDGTHDNDVLLYFPQHDLWHTAADPLVPQFTVHGAEQWLHQHPTGFGAVATTIQDRGWQFDYVSDRMLDGIEAARGGLRATGGTYATLVVPGAKLMPLETLERLVALAKAGATVIFHRALPEDVPGLADLEGRRAKLAALLGEIRRAGRRTAVGTEHRLGWGRFLVADDVDRALATTGARREPAADLGLRVLRRSHDEGKHLFVANLGKEAVDGWVPVADAAASAVVLDPHDGARGIASLRRGRTTAVRLRLEPGESVFLRTFARRRVHGRRWAVAQDAGRAIALDGPWELRFLGRDGRVSAPRRLDALRSWTELGPDAEGFSGTARYTLRFALPRGARADEWALDLGDVRESARVRLNGRELETAWSLPFAVPAGDALRKGPNVLEIEVTNLAANEVRAMSQRGEVDWTRYYIVNITYETFDPKVWPPEASGLLGPVRLVPQRVPGGPFA